MYCFQDSNLTYHDVNCLFFFQSNCEFEARFINNIMVYPASKAAVVTKQQAGRASCVRPRKSFSNNFARNTVKKQVHRYSQKLTRDRCSDISVYDSSSSISSTYASVDSLFSFDKDGPRKPQIAAVTASLTSASS